MVRSSSRLPFTSFNTLFLILTTSSTVSLPHSNTSDRIRLRPFVFDCPVEFRTRLSSSVVLTVTSTSVATTSNAATVGARSGEAEVNCEQIDWTILEATRLTRPQPAPSSTIFSDRTSSSLRIRLHGLLPESDSGRNDDGYSERYRLNPMEQSQSRCPVLLLSEGISRIVKRVSEAVDGLTPGRIIWRRTV